MLFLCKQHYPHTKYLFCLNSKKKTQKATELSIKIFSHLKCSNLVCSQVIFHFWWIKIMTQLPQLLLHTKYEIRPVEIQELRNGQILYPLYFHNIFANKHNLNGLLKSEMSGLLTNQWSSQSYLLLFSTTVFKHFRQDTNFLMKYKLHKARTPGWTAHLHTRQENTPNKILMKYSSLLLICLLEETQCIS